MSQLKSFVILVMTFMFAPSIAQNDTLVVFPNGATAAIALTYDDGLPSHIQTVGPMLKTFDFKATFYPTISSPSLRDDLNSWKDLALQGHELGNHSVYHPCQKSKPGMEWVKAYHDLDHYTLEQLAEELQLADTFLTAIDGHTTRTYAYPCAHFMAGGESYKDMVLDQFTAARDSNENQVGLIAIVDIDLNSVPSWAPVDNPSGAQLIAYIQNIINEQTFSTLTFHGVGAEYLTTSVEAHQDLLEFLYANRDKIWVATFKEISDYVQSKRMAPKN